MLNFGSLPHGWVCPINEGARTKPSRRHPERRASRLPFGGGFSSDQRAYCWVGGTWRE